MALIEQINNLFLLVLGYLLSTIQLINQCVKTNRSPPYIHIIGNKIILALYKMKIIIYLLDTIVIPSMEKFHNSMVTFNNVTLFSEFT